ncbi:MAG: hypothetical protein HOP18_16000 [Deltaproteobacteria bacterium]|nr:hypothetical protein [Deltaproteobacteria bacterium]
MTVPPLHLQLPEAIYQRLQRVAEGTNQPLQSIVIQTIRGNLPPSLDDLRPEWREAVADLPALSDEVLWEIAREPLPARQWRRHQRLLRKIQESVLTDGEKTELAALRTDADRSVTRRSYALALLKWRGHTLPSIDGE